MWASSCFWIVITKPESKKRVSLLKSTKADCARNTSWSAIASYFFSFTSFDCSSSQSRVWKVEAISVNALALQTDFWQAFHSRKCQLIRKETHNPVKQTNPASPKSVVSGVRAGQGKLHPPQDWQWTNCTILPSGKMNRISFSAEEMLRLPWSPFLSSSVP